MLAAADNAQVQAGLDIEQESFTIIDAESQCRSQFSVPAWAVARRIIHAAGDVAIEHDLILPDHCVREAVAALRAGARIWTDSRMTAVGISPSKLAAANPIYREQPPTSIYELDRIHAIASARGQTRAYAAIEQIHAQLAAAILVIGNAPTALLAVLDLAAQQNAAPRLIIGMPVGFVGAAESKARLVEQAPGAYLSIRGRRGGSNLAAATINALAALAATDVVDSYLGLCPKTPP